MGKVTKVFDERTKHLFTGTPGESSDQDNYELPWKAVPQNGAPPLLFDLRLNDGAVAAFAYSDLRELRSPHAGCLELFLLGMAKYAITLDGRNLRDLAKLFTAHKVLSVQEGDPRDTERPEKAPEIVRITIVELAD